MVLLLAAFLKEREIQIRKNFLNCDTSFIALFFRLIAQCQNPAAYTVGLEAGAHRFVPPRL